MKQLSPVLCAVAIDDRDRNVFEHALALARGHDAKMLLLNAVSPQVSFNCGATERVERKRRHLRSGCQLIRVTPPFERIRGRLRSGEVVR